MTQYMGKMETDKEMKEFEERLNNVKIIKYGWRSRVIWLTLFLLMIIGMIYFNSR